MEPDYKNGWEELEHIQQMADDELRSMGIDPHRPEDDEATAEELAWLLDTFNV